MGGAEDGDADAAVDEPVRHLLEVALGAAALGVVGVAPAEEGDVPCRGARRGQSSARTLPLSHLSVRVSGCLHRPGPRPWRADLRAVGAPAPGVPLRAARPGALLHRARRATRPLQVVAVRTTSTGQLMLDVGRRPRLLPAGVRGGGATYLALDADVGELAGHRRRSTCGTVIGSGMQLPFRDAAVDVCYSSNVLEHVAGPVADGRGDAAGHPARRPGLHQLHHWFGPWGGHETAPWHYLGGRRARRRYAGAARPRAQEQVRRVALRGHRSPTACAGRARQQARRRASHVLPRYNPWWSRWLLHVPGRARGGDVEPRARAAQAVTPGASRGFGWRLACCLRRC